MHSVFVKQKHFLRGKKNPVIKIILKYHEGDVVTIFHEASKSEEHLWKT